MTTHFDSATAAKRPQLLKVSDVAQLPNVKPRTIYEMVAQDRPLSQAARLKYSSLRS
jgi:hypothetical protein